MLIEHYIFQKKTVKPRISLLNIMAILHDPFQLQESALLSFVSVAQVQVTPKMLGIMETQGTS